MMADNEKSWHAGLILAVLISGAASAADTALNFKGNLIIPNCVINNNNPVIVDFKNVEIQTLAVVNTVYHDTEFSVSMNCPYSVGTPKLTLSSTNPYNASLGIIRTNRNDTEGLVIHLRQKDKKQVVPLNTPTAVTSSVTGSGSDRTLTLNAGLAQVKGMNALKPGPFTASASLQLRYE
ncbi:TPA: fimbrial protein [Citrobacter werkmanii]|nr:fimbrial protein [Citrobacter werkmanii]